MKKRIFLILSFVVVLVLKFKIVGYCDSSSKNEIIVNDEKLQTERGFLVVNEHIMLPLRDICKKLNYKISWNEKTRQVKVTGYRVDMLLNIDKNTLTINGQNRKVYIPPTIINNITYVTPAVIQAGFCADVVGWKDYHYVDIITRNGINALRDVSSLVKTLYIEDENGFLTGVGEINVPQLDDYSDGDSEYSAGIAKINKYWANYIDNCELLFEVHDGKKDFIGNIYLDAKVIFYAGNILVVKIPCPDDGSSYIGRRSSHFDIYMFNVKTGEEIKGKQLLKSYDGDYYYDMLISAYKKNDKNLMKQIDELKEFYDAESFATKRDTDEDFIQWMADALKRSDYGSGFYIWVSDKDGRVSVEIDEAGVNIPKPNLLNFSYYIAAGYRCFSIDLENVKEYVDMSVFE